MLKTLIEIEGNIGNDLIYTTKKCEEKDYTPDCLVKFETKVMKHF